MDYKEKVIALLKSQELSKEQKEKLEGIFPELKESEDERIRGAIIDHLKDNNLTEWAAWLEKQGEQKASYTTIAETGDGGINALVTRDIEIPFGAKDSELQEATYFIPQGYYAEIEGDEVVIKKGKQKSTDKVGPNFHEKQWITNGDYTWKIVEVKPLDYILQSQDGNIVDDTISHVDEQFHSFTIEDAKDGDVLHCWIDGDEFVLIYKGIKDGYITTYGHLYQKLKSFSEEPTSMFCRTIQGHFTPATKEQRDLLFEKMHEAGYEWDTEKKELKKIEQKPIDETPYPETLEKAIDLYYYSYGNGEGEFEHLSLEKFRDIVHTFVSDYGQKPAWSEEDEGILGDIIEDVMTLHRGKTLGVIRNKINWLKSLKPQPKQKWSEEDEDILNIITARLHSHPNIKFEEYSKEYNWLKSLKQRIGG